MLKTVKSRLAAVEAHRERGDAVCARVAARAARAYRAGKQRDLAELSGSRVGVRNRERVAAAAAAAHAAVATLAAIAAVAAV